MRGQREKDHICLVPFGTIKSDFLREAGDALGRQWPVEYVILPAIPIPPSAFDVQRKQFNTAPLLELLRHTEGDYHHIIGVIEFDLFHPKWSFVFHEADIVLGSALFSTYRLRPEYYGKIPDKKIFMSRVLTEMMHALGHIHGLHHCSNPYCPMYFSTSIGDTDRKGHIFCAACQKKMSLE